MNTPDRSNHPSFYDPEYGQKLSMDYYWIEVQMDDGSERGFAEMACNEDDAIRDAFSTAREHGLRPVAVVSCHLDES